MNIYLKWKENPSFNKEEIPIFDLEISQEEDHFAKARLVVDALTTLPPAGTEGILQTESQEVLFRGCLIGVPLKLEGQVAEIELVAKPFDFATKMASLQQEKRTHPYWDPLWVRAENSQNDLEIQDVRHASLYCDRCSGELSESDWFQGKQTLALKDNFFRDSLQMQLVQRPLKACTIKVHAHWIQRETGVANLSREIRKIFPGAQMSTYTKKALTQRWPEAGKRLGRSGFYVLKSKLKQVTPQAPLYPLFSKPLRLKNPEGEVKTYRLKRHWFKPSLWVGWESRQKRKETLMVTLHHGFQPLIPGEGDVKISEYTLQNINPEGEAYAWRPETYYSKSTKVLYQNKVYMCQAAHQSSLTFEEDQDFWAFKSVFHTPLGDPARVSFFLSERGYHAAEHAMERAKVVLARSARCFEITFEASWEALKDITTDTTIELVDPRLPDGQMKGKVVKYSLIVKGETGERFGKVTLLSSVKPHQNPPSPSPSLPSFSVEGYGEESYQGYDQQVYVSPTGLKYFRYDDQAPAEPSKYEPILKGIELINGPEDQEKELSQQSFTAPSLVEKAISQKPTRLRLFFKDLRTKERIDHTITIKMAEAWTVPAL